MMRYQLGKPPVVRLPPKSNFEMVLGTSSRLSLIIMAVIAATVGLYYAQVILAPVTLAVIVGLMFGPVATRMERLGLPPALSAAVIVLGFLTILVGSAILFTLPLSVWFAKLPIIWQKLQAEMTDWKSAFQSIGDLQDQLKSIAGGDAAMTVEVKDGNAMKSIALMAPEILAEAIIFLASLYFFIATRAQIRISVLSMCFSRRMRWRAAHVFRDVEWYVSRYLLSITIVNLGQGVAVTIAMWLAGVPSPVLWGLLAAALNYVIYIGPATMILILVGVGLASFTGPVAILTPAALYLMLHLAEAQIATPHVLGRTLTLNPFLVFLTIAFWLWLWGPIGGLVAVPLLLIAHAILRNILPTTPLAVRPGQAEEARAKSVQQVRLHPVASPPAAGPSSPSPSQSPSPSRA